VTSGFTGGASPGARSITLRPSLVVSCWGLGIERLPGVGQSWRGATPQRRSWLSPCGPAISVDALATRWSTRRIRPTTAPRLEGPSALARIQLAPAPPSATKRWSARHAWTSSSSLSSALAYTT
jgi:hypothetical protein